MRAASAVTCSVCVILPAFLESGKTDGQVIGAGQQVGDDVGSGVVG
jgi:hypothetical protein